jgi:hypothetical protein
MAEDKFVKIDVMSLMKLYNEHKGNLKAVADALGITQQIPGLIAGIPAEALQVVAGLLAPHLPAPQIEINEVAQATANILLPLLKDEVAKMGTGTAPDINKIADVAVERIIPVLKEQINKIPPVSPENLQQISDKVTGSLAAKYAENNNETKNQLMNLASTLKTIQDNQMSEAKVRELVGVTFQAELAAARKTAAEEQVRQEATAGGPGAGNPNYGGGDNPPQGGYAIAMAVLDRLLAALPVLADAYTKFRPPQNTATDIILKSFLSGMQSGQKLKVGEANTGDVAKEILALTNPVK